MALESGDINEYNQCQTQLKQLYDRGLSGAEMEFLAYRVLYYVCLQANTKYASGNADMTKLLASLPPEAYRWDPFPSLILRFCGCPSRVCLHP